MQIHSDLELLPAFRNAIITIGTFDGVHTGHRKIIAQLKAEAVLENGETVIITFDPHPRTVLGSQTSEIRLINTLKEKIELLAETGIDHLVIVPFTKAFAALPANDYVEKFLVAKFRPRTIIIGYDHRFGNNREGSYMLLESLKEKYGFAVKEIPAHVLHDSSISSTKIRNAIQAGNIEEANEFLGYSYFFEGTVVEGNKLGRTIGYPTANLRLEEEEKLIPGDGVYAVSWQLAVKNKQPTDNRQYIYPSQKGMMNIGVRPTIGGTKRVMEVNLFDFDVEIYGQTLRVYVQTRLRGEIKFSGLNALKEQLAKDKKAAMEALG